MGVQLGKNICIKKRKMFIIKQNLEAGKRFLYIKFLAEKNTFLFFTDLRENIRFEIISFYIFHI